MINKNKLGKKKIFIENDLTWEKRRVQKKIRKWVKEKKEKGLNVKARYARIKINEIWKKWVEIERDEGIGNSEREEERKDGQKFKKGKK